MVENLADAQTEAYNSTFSPTQRAFFRIAEPLINTYLAALQSAVALTDKCVMNPDILAATYRHLVAEKVILLVSRAAVLELNVARQAEELRGATPEERFEAFFDSFDRLAFFEQYPVLDRLLHTTLQNASNYLTEICRNYAADWQQLFPKSAKMPKIVTLKADFMDVYTDGRCVLILKFDNNITWVYKPRDGGVDAAFQDFLAWFNAYQVHLPFRLLTIISHNTYSWNEFVQQSDVFSPEEIEVAFQKIGSLLCFFYLFDATDLHQSNGILSGSNPMMIDLETLLQPRLYWDDKYRSLRRTHFLPNKENPVLPDAEDLDYLEKKGLDPTGKVWTEQKCFCWDNQGQDTMQILRRRVLVEKPKKGLIVAEKRVNPADFAPIIIKSFRKTYRFIEANKAAFLTAVTTCFTGHKLRVITRGTKKYDALIEEMGHPAVLSSIEQQEQLLSALDYESDNSVFSQIIAAEEKKHLRQMVAPSFTCLAEGRDLYAGNDKLIADFFITDALSVVAQNLAEISNKDLEKQVRIIRKQFSYCVIE